MNSGKCLWISCVISALLPGCSHSDRPPLYPVTGVVNFEGKPLPNASVSFLPDEGMVAIGRTNDSGVFSLKTQGETGAMTGSYRVVVTATEQTRQLSLEEAEKLSDADRKKLSKSLIPEKYGNPNASELPAKVEANQKNEFTFNLTK